MLWRNQLRVAADWLAAAILLSLPWSTSATSFLIVFWLVVVVLTLEPQRMRETLAEPAAFLPLALWILAFLGMLWPHISWSEKFEGLRALHKLLIIPFLMFHFSRSENGFKVIAAFLVSVLILLVYSWASLVWPALVWGDRLPGMPVKDSIYQSMFFVIAACVLLHLAIKLREDRKNVYALICVALIAALLTNIAYVVTSRTALIVLIFLVVLIGYQRFGKRGAPILMAVVLLVAAVAWSTSPYLRARVTGLVQGVLHYEANENTSESLRIELWRKSLLSMREAPVIGHGTGSIRSEFQKLPGTQGLAQGIFNPHNQAFAFGIQLGAVGIVMLFLMWLSQILLFRGEGLVPWLGMLVVAQNIVASTFNSHISDFTAGWIYVLGVGILGGMALRQRALARAPGT